jgi:lysine-ketoglutarate reductase/saccharopine dehydrogenase-like protein (TIGR00300 family)
MKRPSADSAAKPFVEDVEVSGHIIDSLLLPKILDAIMAHKGRFEIRKISVGHRRLDPSYALVQVQADTHEQLDLILNTILDHGAVPVVTSDCRLAAADISGSFPEAFYSTTNQRTEVRLNGHWIPVDLQEMDCGIVVDVDRQTAQCIPMLDVRIGQQIVVGHVGVRVFPEDRGQSDSGFEFMDSPVSTEKPKRVAARQVAEWLIRAKRSGGKTLVVGGPAIVHTGSGEYLCELIRRGYIQKLFAGNALATHDIEQSIYGTSLGVHLERGDIIPAGHEHHLRTINTIRRVGGIRPAVEQGVIRSGIMYECVKNNVDYLLAGSIRDDGPLPDVITDAVVAQGQMRERVRDVTFCLMLSTMLHSVAVGNLLPAWVQVVCVDINPSAVIKLADRGSFQTVPVVTDIEPFLRALLEELNRLEGENQPE